jgi:O-antigen ligase|tara:strand:- start:1427 stop:2728 length:1302 start_codon:yes stop_codon:yes gene_type:complete
MNFLLDKILFYIILLLPLGLIIGPAISDIIISSAGLIFLFTAFNKRLFEYFTKKYFIFFLLICFYLIFTSLISENKLLSLESSLFYFRFGVFVIAVLYLIRTNEKFIKFFFIILFFSTLVVAIDGIYQFINGVNFLNFLSSNEFYTTGRISGVFGEEHILGSYIVRLLPLSVGIFLFLNKNNIINNFILSIYLLIISLSIFITGERTATLMLIIFFILTLLLVKNLRFIFFITSIFFISISLLILTLNKELKHRMIDYTFKGFFVVETDNSKKIDLKKINLFSVQHEVVYITSLKIFKDNIFFGIGPKMYRQICKKEKYKTFSIHDRSIDGCQTHPHNTYVQILTETGIIGFIVLLIIFFNLSYRIVFRIIYSYNFKLDRLRFLEIFSLINIFINFWPLMPTGNFFNNWISIIYFLPIGFYIYSLDEKKIINK